VCVNVLKAKSQVMPTNNVANVLLLFKEKLAAQAELSDVVSNVFK
jgi:ACT domain-containing protein